MAEPIDTLFLESIAALPGHAEVESRSHRDPIRDGSSLTVGRCAELSTLSSVAGTWTSPPARYVPKARASTRSGRRVTKATQQSPGRFGLPIPHCCTTVRAHSSSSGRGRGVAEIRSTIRSETSCSASSRRATSRLQAADTKSSAATTST